MRSWFLILIVGCSASSVVERGTADAGGREDAGALDEGVDLLGADAGPDLADDAGDGTCGRVDFPMVGAVAEPSPTGRFARAADGALAIEGEEAGDAYTFLVPGVATDDLPTGAAVRYRREGEWEYVSFDEGPTFAAARLESFGPYTGIELPLGLGMIPFVELCRREEDQPLPCSVFALELGLQVAESEPVLEAGNVATVGPLTLAWHGGIARDSPSPLCFPEPEVAATAALRRESE